MPNWLKALFQKFEKLSWAGEQRKQMIFTRLNMFEVSHISILPRIASHRRQDLDIPTHQP